LEIVWNVLMSFLIFRAHSGEGTYFLLRLAVGEIARFAWDTRMNRTSSGILGTV